MNARRSFFFTQHTPFTTPFTTFFVSFAWVISCFLFSPLQITQAKGTKRSGGKRPKRTKWNTEVSETHALFVSFVFFWSLFHIVSKVCSVLCSFFTHNKACVTPLPLPLLWREEERTRTEQQTLQTNQSHTAADRGGWWIVEWKEERRASLSSFLPYPFSFHSTLNTPLHILVSDLKVSPSHNRYPRCISWVIGCGMSGKRMWRRSGNVVKRKHALLLHISFHSPHKQPLETREQKTKWKRHRACFISLHYLCVLFHLGLFV